MIPHGPLHQKGPDIFNIFKIIPFFFFAFFSNFFKIVKSSISPLIFISITYYYYIFFCLFVLKRLFFFFKANTIYSLWMVVDGFFFDCLFVCLFVF